MCRLEEDQQEGRGEDNICNANIISSCSLHFMASINVCVFHLSPLSSSSLLACHRSSSPLMFYDFAPTPPSP